jgi:hypothetical protein
VYSNGRAIFRLGSGERRAERVLKTNLIEQVVSLA